MVVVNKSGLPIRIVELKQIIPFDGKQYVLPYEIAYKYKGFLTPIQMSDMPLTPPTPPAQQEVPVQPDEISYPNVNEECKNELNINEMVTEEQIEVIKIPKPANKTKNVDKPLKGKKINKTIRKNLSSKIKSEQVEQISQKSD